MEIIWTKPALKNLNDFRISTKKSNVIEYIEKLYATISNLKDYPLLGTTYSYSRKNIIRKLVFEEHIILYNIREETIYILAIFHHKQNINKKMDYVKKFVNRIT